MTNRNVIDIINRLMDPSAEHFTFNADEVFTAIVHGYYYIRPGKNTAKFVKKINKILNDELKNRAKMYIETKDGIPYEYWLWGKMAGEALLVARSMFDEEYYESQVANMVGCEEYDETLLKRYMHWLDDEELESIFEGFLTFKIKYNAFISDENLVCMMDELKAKSLDVVKTHSCYAPKHNEHIDCIENSADFCFAYLCRESIIDTICRYVDVDPLMFACLIKAFKYSDPHTAAEYAGLSILLSYIYELDIYDPLITDVNMVLPDGNDNLKVVHSNKSSKIAINKVSA